MNKQAPVSSGGERRTFPTAWRWQVLSQVSASLERGIAKVPVRSSSLSLQATPSTGKMGNALTPSQGDGQQAWGLLTKLTEKVLECQNHHRKRREFRQHQRGWREGPDPAPAHSAAKTPVDANGSNAGLKGEEWLRVLSTFWKHFPYQQFHSPFALPLGWFFPIFSFM